VPGLADAKPDAEIGRISVVETQRFPWFFFACRKFVPGTEQAYRGRRQYDQPLLAAGFSTRDWIGRILIVKP
jgi:hypothetical protein